MNINELHAQMNERFNRIEELLLRTPAKRAQIPLKESTRDLLPLRVATVEDLFWKMVNGSREMRRDRYKFPRALIENITRPPTQAMVLSVLINQASLRKVFQTRGDGDVRGATASDLALAAIKESNLVVLSIGDTSLDSLSNTLIVLSPGEAQRVAKTSVELPRIRGWSCSEQATARKGPCGIIEAPEDPSGVRKWGADEEEEGPVPQKAVEALEEPTVALAIQAAKDLAAIKEEKPRDPWVFNIDAGVAKDMETDVDDTETDEDAYRPEDAELDEDEILDQKETAAKAAAGTIFVRKAPPEK